MRPHVMSRALVLGLVAVAGLPAAVSAQTEAATPTVGARTGSPQRDTMLKLTRPVTVDFQDKRLEDIVAFITTSSGAEIEPLWVDDQHQDGLDKEKVISVRANNVTYLTLIEKVLDKARGDNGDNTWQMSDTGAIEIGPKTRLNSVKRVEIYDVNDLLMDIPDYTDIPRIDLQQALQSSQGGGGGQSPFREEGNDRQSKTREKKERADEIRQLITQLVETEQWTDNGGSGGTIQYYNGTFIVNAPDYMHRGIDGYKWWPANATNASNVNGRRYVTLTTDQGLSKVAGFAQHEVDAVVGGQIIRSNPPPGGGGNKANPPGNGNGGKK